MIIVLANFGISNFMLWLGYFVSESTQIIIKYFSDWFCLKGLLSYSHSPDLNNWLCSDIIFRHHFAFALYWEFFSCFTVSVCFWCEVKSFLGGKNEGEWLSWWRRWPLEILNLNIVAAFVANLNPNFIACQQKTSHTKYQLTLTMPFAN